MFLSCTLKFRSKVYEFCPKIQKNEDDLEENTNDLNKP